MWIMAMVSVFLPSIAMAFTPPSEKTIHDAIGDLRGLPIILQRTFTPDHAFDPIPKPGPNDWLAVHDEPGQTFDEFKASQPNRPTQTGASFTSSHSAILCRSAAHRLTSYKNLPTHSSRWK